MPCFLRASLKFFMPFVPNASVECTIAHLRSLSVLTPKSLITRAE